MKRYFIIVTILLSSACKTSVLRKQIKGQILDRQTGMPVGHVSVKGFNGDLLATADPSGNFIIPAISKSILLFPGTEKDELAPHSDKIIIMARGFRSDTIFIYKPAYKDDATTIFIDSIYLDPLHNHIP